MPSGFPYMPFFVGDYRADTGHLTTIEHGAYLLLLFHYWTKGDSLPDDPEQLRTIAGVSRTIWRKMSPKICEFFEKKDGRLFHGRVEAELEKARDKSLKAQDAGRKGAAGRSVGKPSVRSASAQPPSNSPSSYSEEECSSSLRSEELPRESEPPRGETPPKQTRPRKSSSAAFEATALKKPIFDVWCAIVQLRWRLDGVPEKHARQAAEVATWLVEHRQADPDAVVRWVQWWWHDPDSMGYRQKVRPWPTNLRNTWDTCFSAETRPEVNTKAVAGNGFETRSERNVRNLKAITEQFGLGQVFDFREDSHEGGHLLGPGDSNAGRSLGNRPDVDGGHRREDDPDGPTE